MTTKPNAPDATRPRPEGSQPDLRVTYQPAGRETLEAIAAELLPQALGSEREPSSPEISVREGTIERDTLAAIMAEAGPTAAPGAAAAPELGARVEPSPTVSVAAAEAGLEIFELGTYVVRGGDTARFATEAARRSFVEEYLLARLPVASMDAVDRVEVTPWAVRGTLIVRVWCRIPLGG